MREHYLPKLFEEAGIDVPLDPGVLERDLASFTMDGIGNHSDPFHGAFTGQYIDYPPSVKGNLLMMTWNLLPLPIHKKMTAQDYSKLIDVAISCRATRNAPLSFSYSLEVRLPQLNTA